MDWTQSGAALVAALIVGAVTLPYAIRIGHAHDLVDKPGKHKRHKRPVPVLGGVAMFISVWLSVGVSAILFPDLLGELSSSVAYILAGALIILLVGLSDDLSPLSAWIKLAAQVAAGVALFMGGLNVELISTPGIVVYHRWLGCRFDQRYQSHRWSRRLSGRGIADRRNYIGCNWSTLFGRRGSYLYLCDDRIPSTVPLF
jgi:UDP-N-acetylmuramyl pentapeptide phosphotransferase/UDP-N-acetylglucosamine-1-phosphate transferase